MKKIGDSSRRLATIFCGQSTCIFSSALEEMIIEVKCSFIRFYSQDAHRLVSFRGLTINFSD